MSLASLNKKAEEMLLKGLSDKDRFIVDIKADGNAVVVEEPTKESPLRAMSFKEAIRYNSQHRDSPIVIDFRGRVVIRHSFPSKIWMSNPQVVVEGWNGGDDYLSAISGKLRNAKNIPENIGVFNYGRSKRISLFLDNKPCFIAVRIFPFGLRAAGDEKMPAERIEAIAAMLLVRAGAESYTFPMLRNGGGSIFDVEIAAAFLDTNIAENSISQIEQKVCEVAEESRKIISAIMSNGVNLESYFFEKSN